MAVCGHLSIIFIYNSENLKNTIILHVILLGPILTTHSETTTVPEHVTTMHSGKENSGLY